MTTLQSEDLLIYTRATVLARVYFILEFGFELQEALSVIFDCNANDNEISEAALKILWAMNKAENKAVLKPALNFRQWNKMYNKFDIRHCIQDFLWEIKHGFLITAAYDERAAVPTEAKNVTMGLLALALRLGLTLDDLNELTTQGFYDLLTAFTGLNETPSGLVMATPEQNEAMWR